VARLDQLERLEALAIELGKSHYRYNAPPKYYSVRPWYSTAHRVADICVSIHQFMFKLTIGCLVYILRW